MSTCLPWTAWIFVDIFAPIRRLTASSWWSSRTEPHIKPGRRLKQVAMPFSRSLAPGFGCWRRSGSCSTNVEVLFLQHDTQKRGIDPGSGWIVGEPHSPEFVHEERDIRTCRARHLRERLVRDFRQHRNWRILHAVARGQQHRPPQTLLVVIEQLIEEAPLDADVRAEHV